MESGVMPGQKKASLVQSVLVKLCPVCHLGNPDGAVRCDCGYDFAAASVNKAYIPQREPALAISEWDTQKQASQQAF
jgi:hypothetical protein